MNKKQKDKLKADFIEKHENTVTMVKGTGWSMLLPEYIEQEGWLRKNPVDGIIDNDGGDFDY